MKKKVLLLIVGLIIIGCPIRANKNVDKKADKASLFKIISLKYKKHYYQIYAERNDSLFQMVSLIEEIAITRGCEKIEVGNYYELHIHELYPGSINGVRMPVDPFIGNTIPDKRILPRLYDSEDYGGPLHLNEKSHYVIYYVSNLNGLFIKKYENIIDPWNQEKHFLR